MIRLENVSLRYQDGPDVLQDISLELEEGSFHFLSGPSGAGKTSLLRLIFLAHRPSAGRVFLLDKDVSQMPRKQLALMRRQLGVVFQDFRLIDHVSLYDNVPCPCVLPVCVKQIIAPMRLNAEWVGLGHQLKAHPATLSGGEQQRAPLPVRSLPAANYYCR